MKNSSGGLFRVSEAANLGLHAMAVLAGDPGRQHSAPEIAGRLRVSVHHLAKVMVRLERAGLVAGTRGPRGGYRLSAPAARTNLKAIYEAVEGPLRPGECMFGVPVCGGDECLLGGFFGAMTSRVADKLSRTRLSQIALKPGGTRE